METSSFFVAATLSLVLTLSHLSTPAANSGVASLEHSLSLSRAWEAVYGLSANAPVPPANLTYPPHVPVAPHLDNCANRTEWRWRVEQRGNDSASPSWADPSACCGCAPQPPWVRGTDAANLALTRQAQRDIWASQFPPNSCSQGRLLLARWPDASQHPVAAQVLVAAGYLSMAMTANRTLVMLPGSFARANHSACKGVGAEGSLDCYFLPFTAPECTARALAAMSPAAPTAAAAAAPAPAPAASGRAGEEREEVVVAVGGGRSGVVASEQAVVVLLNDSAATDRDHCDAVKLWGSPHRNRPSVVELAGKMHPQNEAQLKLRWWQAQALRFMLRWPSALLCHIINRQRHTSYGLSVASQVASVASQRAAIIASLASNNVHPAYAGLRMDGREEAKFLQAATFPLEQSLEADVWPGEGFDGCYQYKGPGPARVDREYEAVGKEVFMLRPVVSLHVRQVADAGASKARVRSLGGFMYSLYGMRKYVPSLSHVWLSSRLQEDIEQSKQFSDWNFLHADHPRQSGPQGVGEYEMEVGLEVSVGASLASLLVAAESDYFAGTLDSDWSRVVDGLRSTNGRLFAGFVAVEEW